MVKRILLLLVLCLSLFLLPGTCSAAQINPEELTRLDQIFNQLEINNNQLLTDLTQSNQDLEQVRKKLVGYQTDLATLQTQLLQLKTESTIAKTELSQAQSLLEKANQSLNEYQKEAKSEIRKLKFERDIAYIVAVAMAFRK